MEKISKEDYSTSCYNALSRRQYTTRGSHKTALRFSGL